MNGQGLGLESSQQGLECIKKKKMTKLSNEDGDKGAFEEKVQHTLVGPVDENRKTSLTHTEASLFLCESF